MTEAALVEGQWKSRWLVLRKPSPVADCLLMLVYKDRSERARGLPERGSQTLEHICGLEPGLPYEGLAHTLAVICLPQAVMLGFDSREAVCAWDARIRCALGEVHRFHVTVAPGTKLESGPATLHLCNDVLVVARDVPPVVTGQWKLSDLRRYGAVPNGFIFEGGTRCGYWAGVFFLSSAEGEQISFLFDCIVRGISPTKGPFGLRPVLPGLSCWDTQATTAGWDGRANQKRSARWGQPETPAPGGAPAHLLSSPGPQTGVGGKPEVTGTVGWGGAGAAGGVPHLVPFPAYGPVLSSSVWAGASWLDLLAGVVAPSAGAVPPCNLVWHGRRTPAPGDPLSWRSEWLRKPWKHCSWRSGSAFSPTSAGRAVEGMTAACPAHRQKPATQTSVPAAGSPRGQSRPRPQPARRRRGPGWQWPRSQGRPRWAPLGRLPSRRGRGSCRRWAARAPRTAASPPAATPPIPAASRPAPEAAWTCGMVATSSAHCSACHRWRGCLSPACAPARPGQRSTRCRAPCGLITTRPAACAWPPGTRPRLPRAAPTAAQLGTPAARRPQAVPPAGWV
ncbi:protein Dok-7 isoform X2 [Desmodus rotundus]|uniref:protein Dok-7 isoform X2 n=1 Tax=Desmodus rotundus TaxID=9430 RepID=UPI00238180A8|nr:protein Dok-7 isoform X2 [Desmodus rotundus]